MANVYPCRATYQRCHPNVPMIRFGNANSKDLFPMRTQYLDNSFQLTKDGYPVGIKILTETEIEWHISPLEDEKTILESTLEDKAISVWNTLTVHNPANYLNIFRWQSQ